MESEEKYWSSGNGNLDSEELKTEAQDLKTEAPKLISSEDWSPWNSKEAKDRGSKTTKVQVPIQKY